MTLKNSDWSYLKFCKGQVQDPVESIKVELYISNEYYLFNNM